MGGRNWSEAEDSILINNYQKMNANELSSLVPGRSIQSIYSRAKSLKIRKGWERQFDKTPTPALAYILGTIEGDGCVSHSRRSYGVFLHVKDECFVESFRGALIKIGLKPTKIYESKKIQRYYVQAWSKPFYVWFKQLSFQSMYKILGTDHMKKEFIRGFYESEGSFSVKGHRWVLEMTNKNKELIEFVQRLIQDIGFSSNIKSLHRTTGFVKDVYRLRLRGGQTKIDRFIKEIKPCIARKSLGNHVPTSSPHRWWTDSDDEFLENNIKSMPLAEIGRKLGRDRSFVHKKAKELGLKTVFCGKGKRWTKEEIEFIKSNYQIIFWIEIAKNLGKSYSSVAQKISGLGLKKRFK